MEIKPCPICNKTPKIKHRDHLGTVTCGPLFGKPHLEVTVYEYYESHVITSAINEWNKKVVQYESN